MVGFVSEIFLVLYVELPTVIANLICDTKMIFLSINVKLESNIALETCGYFERAVPHFYFIEFCEILAMKLNVCKEITSVDLNDKTIASLQPNVSPGRYNLKLQGNKTNFGNSSAQQYFKNPYCNPFQSSSLLAIRTFVSICCVIEMFLQCFNRLFLYFTEFDDHFP